MLYHSLCTRLVQVLPVRQQSLCMPQIICFLLCFHSRGTPQGSTLGPFHFPPTGFPLDYILRKFNISFPSYTDSILIYLWLTCNYTFSLKQLLDGLIEVNDRLASILFNYYENKLKSLFLVPVETMFSSTSGL